MKQPLSRKEKFYLDAFNRGRASAEKELASKDAEIERLKLHIGFDPDAWKERIDNSFPPFKPSSRWFAQCKKCGWVGHSGQCPTSGDHFHTDDDVHCPNCYGYVDDLETEFEAIAKVLTPSQSADVPLTAGKVTRIFRQKGESDMDLFGHVKTRKPPRVMMHVSDAGNGHGDEKIIEFECAKCGHNTGWLIDECSVSENKRGEPCPKCN